jgi:hypothetical protein
MSSVGMLSPKGLFLSMELFIMPSGIIRHSVHAEHENLALMGSLLSELLVHSGTGS